MKNITPSKPQYSYKLHRDFHKNNNEIVTQRDKLLTNLEIGIINLTKRIKALTDMPLIQMNKFK